MTALDGGRDPLRVRWLGTVPYTEALALQRALFEHGRQQHLLLLEHPHVFTYGPRTDLAANVLVDPETVGAELVAVKRGGDVTYHGPGQLVGYPIVDVPNSLGAADHVCNVQRVLVQSLRDLGLTSVGCLPEYPGVWVDPDGPNPRKIAAIGVRLARGRTMHGFALNVTTDMRYLRDYIIPCGIADRPVTSLAEEGIDVSMREVVDVVAAHAATMWGAGASERQDVAWRHRPDDLSAFSRGQGAGQRVRTAADHGVEPTPVRLMGRLQQAGVVGGLSVSTRKPEWLRPKVDHGADVMALKRTVRDLRLVTVCEEAGCPNLSECWADGTATFMVLGERCTRACGFCLVDTRLPEAPDADEPARVADAVEQMGLEHAVLTMVARDDLADAGFAHVAACVTAIRDRRPATRIETLVSDAKGSPDALQLLFDARPDVFNHNVETVARLQRAVRPSAGYARSLGVLSAAKHAGLIVKSGIIVGMGETPAEVEGCLADLASVGVDIVTIGQYLRPTTNHLPVARWVEPHEFDGWAAAGRRMGIGHVEASPLTRSSYHARQALAPVT
ncbi:MAG: lipoyl synthase [Actinobacteria bacterium]|nr:lipoyl synthase [Actinomycetota bacterium]